jgi:hypothetical protein
VVPEDTHVELTYGRTGVEYVSYFLTLLGIVGLVVLWRRPPFRFTPETRRRPVASRGPDLPPGPFSPEGHDGPFSPEGHDGPFSPEGHDDDDADADASGPSPPFPDDAERETLG